MGARREPAATLQSLIGDASRFIAACRRHGVVLAVLFGSQATGKAHARSDIDIAVWLDAVRLGGLPGDTTRLSGIGDALARELTPLLGGRRLDLVILDGASPLLQHQVARSGIPLYEDRTGRFAEFCVRALQRYNDALPFYRRDREYIRRVAEGRSSLGRSRGRPPEVG